MYKISFLPKRLSPLNKHHVIIVPCPFVTQVDLFMRRRSRKEGGWAEHCKNIIVIFRCHGLFATVALSFGVKIKMKRAGLVKSGTYLK